MFLKNISTISSVFCKIGFGSLCLSTTVCILHFSYLMNVKVEKITREIFIDKDLVNEVCRMIKTKIQNGEFDVVIEDKENV